MSKMNVNGNKETNRVNQVRNNVEIKRSEIEKPVSDKVSVEAGKLDFSTRATEVGRLIDNLNELPEVRQERVDSLRARIESGDYNPPADEIARAILKDEQ